VLQDVYVTTTLQGELCVFSNVRDEVRIYLPGSHYERHLSVSLNEWREMARSYHAPNDLDLYNDVINAAWQRAGIQNPINKTNVETLQTQIGKYYPRIWRGIYDQSRYFCYNAVNARFVSGSTYIRSNIAAASLFDQLQELFRYVEPSAENMSAFGNRIRELLILTCTEVEAGWRAVLEANSPSAKDRYTISDYFQLKEPLRLSEWEVSLSDYPDLGIFAPFKEWFTPDTTKSIPWYEAYNAVKHDREAKFSLASLGNLINAVAAVHILQAAQLGPEMYDRFFGAIPSPFLTRRHPVFRLGELCIPTIDGREELSPTRYFANGS
jgi:hypothetical protein